MRISSFKTYSTLLQAKYLQIQTSSSTSATSVMFRANVDNKSKFALIFYPQEDKHQTGIFVDIFALANRCFLSLGIIPLNPRPFLSAEVNYIVSKSPIAPSNKFLILAEGVE
jgi:hypothetical protein